MNDPDPQDDPHDMKEKAECEEENSEVNEAHSKEDWGVLPSRLSDYVAS